MYKDSISADQLRYAGFWRRLGAIVVDGLISGMPMGAIFLVGRLMVQIFSALLPWSQRHLVSFL
jgi:hypothetical protein